MDTAVLSLPVFLLRSGYYVRSTGESLSKMHEGNYWEGTAVDDINVPNLIYNSSNFLTTIRYAKGSGRSVRKILRQSSLRKLWVGRGVVYERGHGGSDDESGS